MMYSLIDTKIVGSILGEEALAAVGSVSILYNLLTGISAALRFSGMTAQNYESGNEKLLKKNVASSIILRGMMTAVVIIFAVLLFLNPILHAMNVPEEQFRMAHDYIRILVLRHIYYTGIQSVCGYAPGDRGFRDTTDLSGHCGGHKYCD